MAKGTTSAATSKLLKRAEKISVRDLAALAGSKKNTPTEVTELVASILAAGIRVNASAIHIEPQSDCARVRHRIDGILSEAEVLPLGALPVVIAGLKILAHILVEEDEQLPQQASTNVRVLEKPYKLHITTLPVEGGEKAVVQLTRLDNKAPTLQQLGYWGPNLRALSEAMAGSKGLILLAGPHDAGQAESAYSILSQLQSPQVSIATVEDPIAYRIAGAAQTQVNQRVHLSFAAGLRTLLKQDANVVMVSNLPDAETARLAVEGALASRLIIAGLYAEKAAAALSYLLASGIEKYLVAHTVRVVVGQRLVRRLCENCKQIYTPSEQDMIGILKSLGVKTAAQLQQVRDLEQQAIEEKVVVGASPASDKAFVTHIYRSAENGCNVCAHTGYHGTIGLSEVLPVSETIQHMILGGASAQNLEDQAAQDGMPTIQTDGLVKALLGLTSIDEVVAATR